jgi:hypothetical protein
VPIVGDASRASALARSAEETNLTANSKATKIAVKRHPLLPPKSAGPACVAQRVRCPLVRLLRPLAQRRTRPVRLSALRRNNCSNDFSVKPFVFIDNENGQLYFNDFYLLSLDTSRL